jgi:hypothetical protein
VNIVEGCPVHKSIHIVSLREPFLLLELVLEYALVQVSGETDVKGAR